MSEGIPRAHGSRLPPMRLGAALDEPATGHSGSLGEIRCESWAPRLHSTSSHVLTGLWRSPRGPPDLPRSLRDTHDRRAHADAHRTRHVTCVTHVRSPQCRTVAQWEPLLFPAFPSHLPQAVPCSRSPRQRLAVLRQRDCPRHDPRRDACGKLFVRSRLGRHA